MSKRSDNVSAENGGEYFRKMYLAAAGTGNVNEVPHHVHQVTRRGRESRSRPIPFTGNAIDRRMQVERD